MKASLCVLGMTLETTGNGWFIARSEDEDGVDRYVSLVQLIEAGSIIKAMTDFEFHRRTGVISE